MMAEDMKEQQVSTLAELQERIVELQLEADRLREAGREDAIAKVREVVEEYGLTPKDIFGRRRSLSGTSKPEIRTGTQIGKLSRAEDQ